jgi:hypothetical protein
MTVLKRAGWGDALVENVNKICFFPPDLPSLRSYNVFTLTSLCTAVIVSFSTRKQFFLT